MKSSRGFVSELRNTMRMSKAGKQHECCRCGGVISIGEQFHSRTVMTGFGWRHFGVCAECVSRYPWWGQEDDPGQDVR